MTVTTSVEADEATQRRLSLHCRRRTSSLAHSLAQVPYLYTAMRRQYDEGLPILRALYFEAPHLDGAYTAASPNGQGSAYLLGDDIIVAPVVTKASTANNLATTKIWLPPGEWFSWLSGQLHVVGAQGECYVDEATSDNYCPIMCQRVSVRDDCHVPVVAARPSLTSSCFAHLLPCRIDVGEAV